MSPLWGLDRRPPGPGIRLLSQLWDGIQLQQAKIQAIPILTKFWQSWCFFPTLGEKNCHSLQPWRQQDYLAIEGEGITKGIDLVRDDSRINSWTDSMASEGRKEGGKGGRKEGENEGRKRETWTRNQKTWVLNCRSVSIMKHLMISYFTPLYLNYLICHMRV